MHPALAQILRYKTPVVAVADAAETTAFLARTSGLSGTETGAYKALINGLVADGVFTGVLDALYIFATNTRTTASLNLVSTNFTASEVNTPTFVADSGYTGNGSNMALDTTFIPSSAGGNFSANSASLGVYLLNSRTTPQDQTAIGVNDASQQSWIVPLHHSGTGFYDINAAGALNTFSETNSQGLWIVSRTGASATALYKNGNTSSVATNTTTASSLPTARIGVLADGVGGTTFERQSADSVAAAFIGGGLSSAQMNKVATRINAYMTTLGINVY